MDLEFKKIYPVVLAVFLMLIAHNALADQNIEISFLDTTEGDAIFLEGGGARFLIDTGPPVFQKCVFEKAQEGDLSVIITHPHPDHYGGMFYLQASSHIKQLFDNGESLLKMQEGKEYAAWYNSIIRGHSNYKALKRGDIAFEDNNLKIEVLWPPSISDHRDYNENSLVLLVTAFTRKILLMGDAPATVESIMLVENMLPDGIDVLKVGHHAASDVTSEKFLQKTAPIISVITGAGNPRYDYKHSDTLRRLKKHSGQVLSTHDTGTIIYTVYADGKDSISVK